MVYGAAPRQDLALPPFTGHFLLEAPVRIVVERSSLRSAPRELKVGSSEDLRRAMTGALCRSLAAFRATQRCSRAAHRAWSRSAHRSSASSSPTESRKIPSPANSRYRAI